MNVDHYFTIGTAHQSQGRPCEDYALSGTLDNGACYGVVTDGCSGANAHTDLGARALAWAFQRTADQLCLTPAAGYPPLFQAKLLENFAQHQYSGEFSNYLATLVGFVATPEATSVCVHGDGAVALRHVNGNTTLIEYEWLDNLPLYLNYHLNPRVLEDYRLRQAQVADKAFLERVTVFKPGLTGPEVLSTHESTHHLDSLLDGYVAQFRPQQDGIVALAVMSDGHAQVGARTSLEVAHEFLNFKTTQGEFTKRRLLRALRDFHKQGDSPCDDIGMAAVWFGTGPQVA